MQDRHIGDVRVTRIEEQMGPGFPAKDFFPEFDADTFAAEGHWLAPSYYQPESGRLMTSIHSWLLRTGKHTILVDACSGNHKPRPGMPRFDMLNTQYLERLREAGVEPEEIDFVMCTHLHVDHVGWNTRLLDGRWVPTFPRARYLMGQIEYEHWEQQHRLKPERPVNHGSFEDSVLPVVAAGQAEFVKADHCLFDDPSAGLRFVPAPGHTIGNMMIDLRGGQDHAVMSGDVIHHPIQCAAPWLANAADFDPAAALATRLNLLRRLADTPSFLLTGHFPAPTAGRVVSHGDAFRFRFEDD
jgi:glyoxylase-like metal-dependent hydrolase (beta-lactamase superfamily II)